MLTNMQIQVNDQTDGLPAVRRLPCAVQGNHNPGIPSYVVTLKERQITTLRVEWNKDKHWVAIRGSRKNIIDNIEWLIGGFGNPSDLSGPSNAVRSGVKSAKKSSAPVCGSLMKAFAHGTG